MSEHELQARARALFNSDFVPEHVNDANREKWIRMILWLGPRWLLMKKVSRIA